MLSLKEFTYQFKDIPEKSLDTFIKLASKVEFKKNEFVIKFNDISTNFYIIKSGIIRSYLVDEKGKEYTRTFFTHGKPAASLNSLISKQPSKLAYECLTDCTLYKINYKDFLSLTKTDINIANLYAKLLEYVFFIMESEIYNLAILDATERYLKLKNEIPEIENIITQYHIAAYLNISAVQLSRIRKKLYSQ
ncbi:Crp/Fnr family transcriptional regulator [Polaribacter vadi]|uniref:Crp/Fnr family transcriptional regulator n=1 Tax=Polaribacter TaxID=52959 RepID=UPI001C0A61CC|nr:MULTISPECIES: Crp/Fnr family transcriptional regulator [Polaribacter]MBU3011846.1 Crp/Fnr family transcriptional regulator [Polaribacter vadi]MDO6741660.1 Crp/Fnr family transcriptional regulator [Polaribacter sp. 1_MG-2023]